MRGQRLMYGHTDGNELGAEGKHVATLPCSTSNHITGGKTRLNKSEVVRIYGGQRVRFAMDLFNGWMLTVINSCTFSESPSFLLLLLLPIIYPLSTRTHERWHLGKMKMDDQQGGEKLRR
ncbi:hypothetical protein ATANTOWER_019916 [Ataeniobius toweri]|uniref:Uncharacterized protein n=1 Tax=Ataeniobius toweri TaxID=208326 RepID=A0ABU7C8I4_9TELE|nr:hypothetical protein [Ataeniobius toweri]